MFGYRDYCLTLLRMDGGEGGGVKRRPTSFSSVTSANVGIRPPKLSDF